MSFDMRLFTINDRHVPVSILQERLVKAGLPMQITVDTGDEAQWEQISLQFPDEHYIACIVRDVVTPGSIGEEEIGEFYEQIDDKLPARNAVWLHEYLGRTPVIYAIQRLSGVERKGGADALFMLMNTIHSHTGGLFQVDDMDGCFFTANGEFLLDVFPPNSRRTIDVAVLHPDGYFMLYPCKLGCKSHRNAFRNGEVPPGVEFRRMG